MFVNLKQRLAGWMGQSRYDHTAAYILMRDLALLSAPPRGPEGHAALRSAFLHLLTVLRPSLFCDIGAFDGATSLDVRSVAPGCEVHAFEANPETHSHHAPRLRANGIHYHQLAISSDNGRSTVHAPRGRHAAKTSLLLRQEEMEYDRFEVQTRSLDRLFKDRLGEDGATFFLWIDVEGAAERVLSGASRVLRRTLAVFVECETFPFWQEGGSLGPVADILLRSGFVPVARDREYGDKQFNILFVAGSVVHQLTPYLFDARSPLRACLTPAAGSMSASAQDHAASGESSVGPA